MERLLAHRRPNYPAIERLAILELRAACGWSQAETARRLLVGGFTTRFTVHVVRLQATRIGGAYTPRLPTRDLNPWLPRRNAPRTRSGSVGIREPRTFSSHSAVYACRAVHIERAEYCGW